MLLVSACSEGGSGIARGQARDVAGSSDAGTQGSRGDTKDFTHALPIAAYEYSAAQERLIAKARDGLTRACMRRFGLDYHPADAAVPEAPTSSDRRYGISDPREAERYGYHLAPSPRTVPVASTDPSYPVLYGTAATYHGKEVPKGGCGAEAVRTWEKQRPATEAADVARDIAINGFNKSLSDPSVIKATRAWASCMKGQGFPYPSPLSPPHDFDLDTPSVSDEERKVAVADLSCKERTDLLKIWSGAESRIQRADIEANKGRLARLSEEHREVAEFARSISQEPSEASRSDGG
ncbi:hypothetical protein ABT275_20140 [Streptomyces sp. NPDC001185]|uniref:hypothetical protein n=1 Tax=Streptomyces sp. NPDC001185 TaxID=3154380 RepID=UPI0033176E7F